MLVDKLGKTPDFVWLAGYMIFEFGTWYDWLFALKGFGVATNYQLL